MRDVASFAIRFQSVLLWRQTLIFTCRSTGPVLERVSEGVAAVEGARKGARPACTRSCRLQWHWQSLPRFPSSSFTTAAPAQAPILSAAYPSLPPRHCCPVKYTETRFRLHKFIRRRRRRRQLKPSQLQPAPLYLPLPLENGFHLCKLRRFRIEFCTSQIHFTYRHLNSVAPPTVPPSLYRVTHSISAASRKISNFSATLAIGPH